MIELLYTSSFLINCQAFGPVQAMELEILKLAEALKLLVPHVLVHVESRAIAVEIILALDV